MGISANGFSAAAGIGSTIVGVFSLVQNHQNMQLQRELADETALQLDRHHAENLAALREQGRLNREVLTTGLDKIEEALLSIANREHKDRVSQIGGAMEPIFEDPDGDHPNTIAYLSNEFHSYYSNLYFVKVFRINFICSN